MLNCVDLWVECDITYWGCYVSCNYDLYLKKAKIECFVQLHTFNQLLWRFEIYIMKYEIKRSLNEIQNGAQYSALTRLFCREKVTHIDMLLTKCTSPMGLLPDT